MKQRMLVFWSGILGNTIDHYDVAIYAFLAPFIAPIFFKQDNPIVALISTYGLMSLGLFTRPLGALVFGRMATYYSPKKTLMVILLGVLFSTLAMGLIPGYDSIGALAPILLAFTRMLQGFFAAGEITVAPIFILEQENNKSLGRASSYYECSTMLGIGIAALAAAWIGNTDNPENYWRYAFYASALTALPVLVLRLLIKDLKIKTKQRVGSFKAIFTNKYKLLRIILISGFSYLTYAVPFIFMSTFVPHLSSTITNVEMLAYDGILSIFDIAMILLFGKFVDSFPLHKWMALMSGLLACTIIPLFYLLPTATLLEVMLIRTWIIILGVAFLAPLNAFIFNLLKNEQKYLLMGVGHTIGTQTLGGNTVVFCWLLFYYFQTPLAPAIYIVVVSLAMTIVLLIPWKRKNHELC